MLSGAVNPFREAVIRLEIRGPQGQSAEVEAIIDTGYDSYLTLPQEIINRLGLPYRGTGEAELADGTPAFF